MAENKLADLFAEYSSPLSTPQKENSPSSQRSKKRQRQATRLRRRTDGTVEGELCSKSKCLAPQGFLCLMALGQGNALSLQLR